METWKKYKPNWIPRAVLVLLYLTMLSVWWLSGLSARFVTGATVEDDARVAVFNVTGSGKMSHSFAVVMKPGDGYSSAASSGGTVTTQSGAGNGEDIIVSVTNSSETAVSYTIAFLLDGNLPITVTTPNAVTAGTTTGTGTGTTEGTGTSTTAGTGQAGETTGSAISGGTANPATAGATTTTVTADLTPDSSGEPVWTTAAAMAGAEKTYTFHLAWDSKENGYQFSEGIESIIVEVTAMQED